MYMYIQIDAFKHGAFTLKKQPVFILYYFHKGLVNSSTATGLTKASQHLRLGHPYMPTLAHIHVHV